MWSSVDPKRVRLFLGGVPGAAGALVVLLALGDPGGIDLVNELFWSFILLPGPFVAYYFLVRTMEFSIMIGLLLDAVAGWAVFWTFEGVSAGHSTAGVSLLFISLLGYPLVLVGAFLDRLSR